MQWQLLWCLRFRRCRYPDYHAMVQLPDHYCAKHHEHEAEYIANSQRWARTHSQRYQRKYNTVTRYRNDAKSKQYNFYRMKQWQELRQRTLDRDHYVCQYCGQPNCKTVDHIVPIEFDQSLMTNPTNLCTICRKCHRAKTDWEQSYYGTGKNNKIKPIRPVKNIGRIYRLMQTRS